MLTIINPDNNNRQTDYSRDYLTREARHIAKHAPESDGKLRAWSIVVLENRTSAVALRVDYLRRDGTAATIHSAL